MISGLIIGAAMSMYVPPEERPKPGDREPYTINMSFKRIYDSYGIRFGVEDKDAAIEELNELGKPYGCALKETGGGMSGRGSSRKRLTYCSCDVPAASGKRAADALAAHAGKLEFKLDKAVPYEEPPQIKEEFEPLRKEYEAHAKDLDKIPVAASLMEEKLRVYERYLKFYGSVSSKSEIGIVLEEACPDDGSGNGTCGN